MKKNIVLSLAVLMGLSIFNTQAMEDNNNSMQIGSVAPQYKGVYLTPNNISQFAQMPEGLGFVVNRWAEENKNLLHTLIPPADKTALNKGDALLQIKNSVNVLEEAKIQIPYKKMQLQAPVGEIKFPGYSYIFELPEAVADKKYYIQIAGPLHRIYNLESYNGIGWGQGLKENSKVTPTLQTVSRVWHYLQTKQTIEQQGISKFYVPPTYLAQVPERNSIATGAFDENSFVVQEDRGDEWVLLRKNKKLLQNISEETINQFYKVLKQGILWDVNGNVFINTQDYSLGQSDLEQPNNQNPEIFGYNYPIEHNLLSWNANGKEAASYKISHDKGCAILGFAELLKDALKNNFSVSNQCKVYQELIKEDKEIDTFPEDLAKRCREALNFENN